MTEPKYSAQHKSWRDKALAGLGWAGLSQIVTQLLRFGISVILARLLSPDEFGIIGMVTVFSGFTMLFSEAGFGSAIIQKLNVEKQHLDSVFWMNVGVGIAYNCCRNLSARYFIKTILY